MIPNQRNESTRAEYPMRWTIMTVTVRCHLKERRPIRLRNDMNIRSLINEFQAGKPEVVIVDALIKQTGTLVFMGVILLFGLLSQLGRKYLPSIKGFLTPGLPWIVGAACVVGGIVFYNDFTNLGCRNQLMHLLRLLRQYNRFGREKEMEIVSRIHSQTRAAALVFLTACFMSFPLAFVIWYWSGVAMIVDVTNNIKGTHIHPTFGSKLFFNGYGVLLGLSFSWIVQLLDSARSESLLLSAKYRRKKILTESRII
jgi:hypothetical protein